MSSSPRKSSRRLASVPAPVAEAAAPIACKDAPEYFRSYLEGQLPPGQEALIRRHLETCPRCAHAIKDHQQLHSLLNETLGARSLDRSFDERADKRLHERRAMVAAGTTSARAITAMRLGVNGEEEEEELVGAGASGGFLDGLSTRMGAAPWWIISGAFHALLLLLLTLVGLAVMKLESKDTVIVTNLEKSPPPPVDEKQKERDVFNKPVPIESELPPVENPVVTHEEVEVSDHNETADNMDDNRARGDENAVSDVNLGGTGTSAAIGVGGGGGGAYGQRGAGGRRRLAMKGGGGKATESAVDKALEWLAKHQEADGSWDVAKHGGKTRLEPGITGLALLAFLGAGHTEKVGKYKENVQRAVRWLAAQQQDNGFLCAPQYNYSQAIAGMALSEAAGMGRVPDTVKAAQKAIDATCGKGTKVEDLSERGGWSYAIPQHATVIGDLSNSGWTIMFLKSARTAGLKVPAQAFDGAIRFLDACEIKDPKNPNDPYFRHHYNYGPLNGQALAFDDAKAQITFVGLLNRQFMGAPREELQKAAEWAMNKGKVPNNGKWGYQGLYYIYYGTLVAFQQGGDMWKEWNAALKETLLPTQVVGGANDGSWDPHGQYGSAWGRVGQTALSAMCLEVYYRYLPLYR